MMKCYLRLFIIIACLMTTWSMNAEKYWLSHCQGVLADKAAPVIEGMATVRVATLFSADEMSPLSANSITTLRFGIISKLKLEEVTVWISDNLEKEPLRSMTLPKADLASGWNEVELDTPLIIDGQPLYIGYTFSQPSKCNVIPVYTDNGTYPLWLDKGNGWDDITSDCCGAFCVEAGIEGSYLSDHGVEITSVNAEYPVVEAGSTAFLRVDFINTGILPFSHLSYTVSHPSGKAEGEADIPLVGPRERGCLRIWLPLENACDPHPATIGITAVEGDRLKTIPEGEVMLTVAEAPLLQRNVLLEDFSNEYCSNCPAAATAIESAIASLDEPFRVNAVTHHAGSSYDFFTLDGSKEYECFYTGSKYSPMALFDRTYVDGKINFTPSSEAVIRQCLNAEFLRSAEASLSITPYIDTARGLVEVNAHGTIDGDRPVNLTLFVTENNVAAINQSGVSGEYLHDAMLRSIGDTWGTPVEKTSASTFQASARTEFKNKWKRDNCRIIAFLTDNDPESATYRAVLQSISLPLAYAVETDVDNAGVGETDLRRQDIEVTVCGNRLAITGDYKSIRVFTSDGVEASVDNLPDGLLIVVVALTDGRIQTKKIIN